MKEFPVTTKTIMGRRIIFSGGGYLASPSSIATRPLPSELGWHSAAPSVDFAFLRRDSAIAKRAWMALAAPSVPSGAVFFD